MFILVAVTFFQFFSVEFSLLVSSLVSRPWRLALGVLPSAFCPRRLIFSVLPSASRPWRFTLGIQNNFGVPISVPWCTPAKTPLGGIMYQLVYPGTPLPNNPLRRHVPIGVPWYTPTKTTPGGIRYQFAQKKWKFPWRIEPTTKMYSGLFLWSVKHDTTRAWEAMEAECNAGVLLHVAVVRLHVAVVYYSNFPCDLNIPAPRALCVPKSVKRRLAQFSIFQSQFS